MNALRGLSGSVVAAELAKFLSSKSNLVVAKAADLAREGNHKSLEPQLADAFFTFMKKPTESDRGCAAKQAIVNALYEHGCDAENVFLAGSRHRQIEGTYGPPTDVAAETRGLSAMGLVRMAYRDVMPLLVDLLADETHTARIMAARAIAYAGRDEGALLLRLKVLLGDAADVVTGECLIALGALARTKSLPFVRKYLSSENPTLAESAALAIGEMRDPAALEILIEQWNRDRGQSTRHTLLLPNAIARLPRSVDFLVGVVTSEPEGLATAAVEALRIYRHDEAVRAKVERAVRARGFERLTARYEKLFL
jgi:HEAT repeat protein